MKASDLSYSQRQDVLSQIRKQIGSDSCDQMVNTLGEEGFIDFVLAQANAVPSQRAVPKRATKNPWNAALEVTLGALECLFTYGMGFQVYVIGQWNNGQWNWIDIIYVVWGIINGISGLGPIGFILVVAGIYLITAICVGIYNLLISTVAGVVVKIVAVIASIAGVVYLLWIGIPWVITGVGQWWAWLGEHFVK
jgi:hypothetical protein